MVLEAILALLIFHVWSWTGLAIYAAVLFGLMVIQAALK
jgi:hypothetical protein